MNPDKKLADLKEYMESEFGVTPENIDEKLKELKAQFYERLGSLEEVAI